MARSYLERYFGLSTPIEDFSGRRFDTFGSNDPNRYSPDDVMAVACLSIHVPVRAGLGILNDLSDEISRLLMGIPVDLSLDDISLDDHKKYFGDGSPALRLWHLLRRSNGEPWGVGSTTASKLMARKRPGLIPIYDSIVGRVTGLGISDNKWLAWHTAFATEPELVGRLKSLRSAVGLQGISLLRVLDVVLWMYGSQEREEPESVDQADG
jgi:hypothetical protein